MVFNSFFVSEFFYKILRPISIVADSLSTAMMIPVTTFPSNLPSGPRESSSIAAKSSVVGTLSLVIIITYSCGRSIPLVGHPAFI